MILAGAVALLGVTLWLSGAGGRVAHVERTRQKLLLYRGGAAALAPGSRVEQQFTAFYPGLSALDVLVYVFPGTPGRTLTVRLRRACTDPGDIFATSETLPQEGGPYFYTITLPQPLDDSAGKGYCLLLDAPQATGPEGIVLPLSEGDLYPHGRLTVFEPPPPPPTPAADIATELPYKIYLPLVIRELQPGPVADIGFLLHYEGLPGPTLQTFAARLTANKPYLWGSAWFYVGLLLAYLVLLGGLALVARWSIKAQ